MTDAAPAPETDAEKKTIAAMTPDERKAYDALTPDAKKAAIKKADDDAAAYDKMTPSQKEAADEKRGKVEMVTVSSDLPSGLVLNVGGKTYTVPGPDRENPKQKFGHVQIPKKFWNLWIAEHQDFGAVVNGNLKGPPPDEKAKDDADKKAATAKDKARDPNEPPPPRIPTGQSV